MTRIAVCAPSTPLTREDADRVLDLAAAEFPGIELAFHEQCFAVDGHFAGPDAMRRLAFLDCANDPAFDAVWFARGGYGANRIAADTVAGLDAAQRFDRIAQKHGMTRSEFYRRAAERYAHELADADLTTQIDEAIDAVGQPGEESAELRRAANVRLLDESDEW